MSAMNEVKAEAEASMRMSRDGTGTHLVPAFTTVLRKLSRA